MNATRPAQCPTCGNSDCPVVSSDPLWSQCPGNQRAIAMDRAFALVTPDRFGARDWREPVHAVISGAELHAAGLTIADVKEAVIYMTSTEASVRTWIVAGGLGDLGLVYHVTAIGYRGGPAGP